MLLLIGSTKITSIIEEGHFYCTTCRHIRDYYVSHVQTYTTLFWVPLFPIERGEIHLICETCKAFFQPNAFALISPEQEKKFWHKYE